MTRRRFRWIAWIFVSLVAVVMLSMLSLSLLSGRRPPLGPVEGQLPACPESPNCVCSFDTDQEHGIAPLDAGDDPAATMNQLRTLLRTRPRVQVVADDGTYLHAEFTTPLLRFVDDVEFLLDESAGIIHVRSASRVGRSDFGTNRQRVEELRRQLSSFAATQ